MVLVLSKVILLIYVCIYHDHFKNLFKEHTSYIEHFELYTEIPGPSAVVRSQIELMWKDIILLTDVAQILYKASLRTCVQHKHIKFTLSAGTYAIDDLMQK